MKKNIVILGAGFAGLRVALDLTKKFAEKPSLKRKYNIKLVDRNAVHVFNADLYEVATAFSEKITDKFVRQLKDTVATPIHTLIDENYVDFVQDEIVAIDPEKQVVVLKKTKKLPYHCLVVAMGSCPNYFGIPGLKENSFTLDSVADALKINSSLDKLFYDLWKSGKFKPVHLNVGGGGPTGIETACELVFAVKRLAKKYKYPTSKIKVQLVEGSEKLAGLDKDGTKLILKRLKEIGVKVYMQSFIKKLDQKKVFLKAGGSLNSDMFIWTGGVMVNTVVAVGLGDKRLGGGVLVNPFLQAKSFRNVFAAGDNGYFPDPENVKKRLPMLAQFAYAQGSIIAENVLKLFSGESLKSFVPGKPKLLLPLGGKYGILSSSGKIHSGFLMWLLKRLVFLKYAMSILPFTKAFRKWKRSNKIFVEND